MNCPAGIARVLLEIIETAILRIRAAGWSGDASRCAVEADHIHNLPHLLADYSSAGLRFYWEVEKPSYEQISSASDLAVFRPLWAELQQIVDQGEAVQAP